jgi:hypothetical protein
MKRIGKMLVVILAASLLAAVGSMFNPRTAHALVAALVQVSNTAAAPAITLDVSRVASQNVQLACGGNQTKCFQILPDGTAPAVTGYIVPAGRSLVITTVDISTIGSGSGSALLMQTNSSGESTRASWTFAAGPSFQFQYPSGIVLSSGSEVFVDTVSPPFNGALLTGYLVNSQ